MPYRDDLEAATSRRDALARELAAVEQRLTDQVPLQAKARELRDQLDDVTRQVEHAQARVSLPLLHAVTVATPCKEPWAKMSGDERVRFCGRCEKNVFNLSGMTGTDAEALLREKSGGDLCVRFFRRPDGTILTSDCPVGAKKKRRRRMMVTAVAVAAGALGVAWALVPREQPRAESHTVGAIAVPQPDVVPDLEEVAGGIGEMPATPPVEPAR